MTDHTNASKNTPDVKINGADNATSTNGPEVFLGGSCNPTTWRADVAIPALNQLGISFYNPVSTRFNLNFIDLNGNLSKNCEFYIFLMKFQF